MDVHAMNKDIVMHDHNYYLKNKQKCKRSNAQKYLNHHEILLNDDYDEYSTTTNYLCVVYNSSEEENDIEDMPLSKILKMELEQDLLPEVRLYLIMF